MTRVTLGRWFGGFCVLALLLGAIVVVWARHEACVSVEARAISAAQRYGWELTIGAVELGWRGEVTLRDLRASGPRGGTLHVNAVTAEIPLDALLEGQRTPEAIHVHGLTLESGRAELAESRRLSSRPLAQSSASPSTLPIVFFHDARLSIDAEPLGRVDVGLPSAELRRSRGAWSLNAVVEASGGHRAVVAAVVDPMKQRGHLSARWLALEPPLITLDVGRVAFRSVEVDATPDAVSGVLGDLSAQPTAELGVDGVEVATLSFNARRGARWRLESLQLDAPTLRGDLGRMLRGPLRRWVPTDAVDALRQLQARVASDQAPLVPLDQPLAALSGDDEEMSPLLERLGGSLPEVSITNGRVDVGLWADERAEIYDIDLDLNAFLAKTRLEHDVTFSVLGVKGGARFFYPQSGAWPEAKISLVGVPFAKILTQVPERWRWLDAPAGLIDVDVTLSGEGDARAVKGNVTLREVGFFHPALSSAPIHGLNASLDVDLKYDPKKHTLSLTPMTIKMGALEARLTLNIDRLHQAPWVRYDLEAEPWPCAAIPAAIPGGMLTHITALELGGGQMQPRLYGTLRWDKAEAFELEGDGFPGDCYVSRSEPFDVPALNRDDYTKTYTDYLDFEDAVTVGPGSGGYVSIDDVPRFVYGVMYLTEDRRFFLHKGVQLRLLRHAVRVSSKYGRFAYGGSTVTQQLAKNLFLDRSKNLARKFQEILLAWAMERHVEKRRLLELYMNCIEFGPDIYGVVQAARFYFNKRPQHLSPIEAAYLASLKSAPRFGGFFYEHGFPTGGHARNFRLRKILRRLVEYGYLEPHEAEDVAPWNVKFYRPPARQKKDFRNAWLKRRKDRKRAERARERAERRAARAQGKAKR